MSYIQLTLQERYVIAHLKLFKLSVREIARRLNRHHSTISREIRRNGPRYPGGVYWYESAQPCVMQRRAKPRHQRRRNHPDLYRYVVRRLQAHWSPEMIAGRIALDYPRERSMRVSLEGLYRWVYRDAQGGGTPYRGLQLAHKRRRRQRR